MGHLHFAGAVQMESSGYIVIHFFYVVVFFHFYLFIYFYFLPPLCLNISRELKQVLYG